MKYFIWEDIWKTWEEADFLFTENWELISATLFYKNEIWKTLLLESDRRKSTRRPYDSLFSPPGGKGEQQDIKHTWQPLLEVLKNTAERESKEEGNVWVKVKDIIFAWRCIPFSWYRVGIFETTIADISNIKLLEDGILSYAWMDWKEAEDNKLVETFTREIMNDRYTFVE